MSAGAGNGGDGGHGAGMANGASGPHGGGAPGDAKGTHAVRHLTLALVALLLLAGLSFVLRFADLGTVGMPVALAIAGAKAAIILVFFMEVLEEGVTSRLALATGAFLFATLILLLVADIVTRAPPAEYPPGIAERARG